jgi:hypothetical protein
VRCPYCFTDLDATEPEVRCARCTTPHHEACFLEHGRCVTFGCGSRESRSARDVSVVVRRRLEVHLGPERHPFHRRGGYQFGDPRWLEVVSHPPDLGNALAANRIDVALATPFAVPGGEVSGEVSLRLVAPLRARAVRLLLRTVALRPGGFLPQTLLEREAVLTGMPWEGHLRALGIAVRTVLNLEGDEDLTLLAAGITRWHFRFRLDHFHPARSSDARSVTSELVAYVDVPAGLDFEGRVTLPVVRRPV